jgi:hypothetical protein
MKRRRERRREGHARYKQTKAIINYSSALFFVSLIHPSYSAQPIIHESLCFSLQH